MKKLLILFVFISLLLTGCIKKDSVEEDYVMLKGISHVYEKVTYDEVVDALTVNQGSYVIFFAFNPKFYECPFCMAVVLILNDVAISEGFDRIMYLDIYEMRMNYTADYQLLVGYLDSKVNDLIVRDGKKTLVVPDVYFVKDGEIKGHHIATIKDQDGKYIKDLTTNEIEQLKSIYRDMFQRIK